LIRDGYRFGNEKATKYRIRRPSLRSHHERDFAPFQRDRKALSPGPIARRMATARLGIRRAAMAMTMNGEVQLNAPREAVWAKLNDAEVLKVCIPGCQQLDKTSDTEFVAIAVTKIGPVKATWKGKVHLTDLDPPNGYKISGEGEGGIAGFAKGGAVVALSDKDGGTLLTYNVEAQIGGKLAQLGQRLIAGTAKKMADEFFSKFAAAVAAG
jgi:carbon monoxide dehydrogenase subunit G